MAAQTCQTPYSRAPVAGISPRPTDGHVTSFRQSQPLRPLGTALLTSLPIIASTSSVGVHTSSLASDMGLAMPMLGAKTVTGQRTRIPGHLAVPGVTSAGVAGVEGRGWRGGMRSRTRIICGEPGGKAVGRTSVRRRGTSLDIMLVLKLETMVSVSVRGMRERVSGSDAAGGLRTIRQWRGRYSSFPMGQEWTVSMGNMGRGDARS